jgi:hypothetical protein
MAKGAKNKKRNKPSNRSKTVATNVHPLIVTAVSNGAKLDRGTYEVAKAPNPYGEIIIRGEVRAHKVVRRVPQHELLYRHRIIDRRLFVALEWYFGRLGMAEAGMIKSGLNIGNSGGGSAQTHIPTSEAAIAARSDIRWAQSAISTAHITAFLAVMHEQESFIECARRLHAKRYVRVSVERARRNLKDQFVKAATAMADHIAPRLLRVG